ncbi:MAG: ribosome recycling factor [bacterium]|nr:ribosome recycling factor [Myxococcales bacterium]
MEDEIYADLNESFENAYAALRKELARVRSGRANTNLLDGIRVSYYGQPTPLNQVANLSVPEPRLITIKPWEKNMLGEIEKAIQQANLGINPNNDGVLIRLVIQPLTEERRKQFVKQVREHGEAARVSARNARRDANTLLDGLQKDGDISEDDMHRAKKRVQDHTDEAIKKIDEILAKKEAELMEI